jgi:hypothetical protein
MGNLARRFVKTEITLALTFKPYLVPAVAQTDISGSPLWFSNLSTGQMDDFLDIADPSLPA